MIKVMQVGTESPLKPARHREHGGYSEVLAPELRYDIEIQNMFNDVVHINTATVETCETLYIKTKEGNSYCIYGFTTISGKTFYSFEYPWDNVE